MFVLQILALFEQEGFGSNERDYIIFNRTQMHKNTIHHIRQMEMSIYTFNHDYYMLELPPRDRHTFYTAFPLYKDKLNFKGELIKVAPVIRIYGTNQYGEKCCGHVHGYFPYLYIKIQEYSQAVKDQRFLLEIMLKFEAAYQAAFKTDKPILYRGEVQQKFDFYGYHTRHQLFLKLFVFDPLYIPKLRELLSSKVVGGRAFQCYQAHISYYMHFFSDLNIYGINQMKICGFTFRRNTNFMQLFEKVSSKLVEGIVHKGWQLQKLQADRPECFNLLHKTSSCYIEIDFQYQAIMNAYHNGDSSEGDMQSSDEEIVQKIQGKRRMKVTVTKALQYIWKDEKKKRNRLKIQEPLQAILDFTKNIETTNEVQKGLTDPLWINFIEKGENGHNFINMLKSYAQASILQPFTHLQLDIENCYNYQQIVAQQKASIYQKVQNRRQYYERRKNNIIGQLLKGQKQELPEWDQDQSIKSSQEESQESQNEDDILEGDQAFQSKTQAPKITNKLVELNNTIKYRNNFKFQLADFKNRSIFSQCKFCRQKIIDCTCLICQQCGQEQCRCIVQQTNQQANMQIISQQNIYIQYCQDPPSYKQVRQAKIVQYQRPYYSKIHDLYQHYKLGSNVSMEHKMAQYLDKQLKNTIYFNREPSTIKNQLKLPYFFEIYCWGSQKDVRMSTYQLQYMPQAPKISEAMSFLKKKQQKMGFRGTTTNKFQDTFLADLVILSFDIIVQIKSANLYIGNPQKHQIIAIAFELYNLQSTNQNVKGIILQQQYAKNMEGSDIFDQIMLVADQRSILSLLINLVFRVDPDIFMSWDMQKKGMQYLIQRAIHHEINIIACLSRVCDLQDMFEHINLLSFSTLKQTYLKRQYLTRGNIVQLAASRPTKDNSYYLSILNQKIKKTKSKRPLVRHRLYLQTELKGRVNISIMRFCQQLLKLRCYSLQAVVKHIYGTQIAQFTDAYLCRQLKQSPKSILQYVSKRVEYCGLVAQELNLIGGPVQKSKVYGVDFLSMMERGTQFKIQSVLCRTTKQNGYVALSATKQQVSNQGVLDCRPLVLQPPKQFICEPVLLFDFQSLYPSVMIAYNLCYSTCLGSIKELFKSGKLKKLGVSSEMSIHLESICECLSMQDEDEMIRALSNYIFVSPNKVAFVKKSLKQGIIPKILLEFLITRIMIKNSIKLYHKESLKSILKERQLGLKMFMNVTFGYIGATFTGRMPCSQIADAVVQVSKYCLRKSIDYLNSHPIYKGKVLYGDTDSIFFHLPNYKISETFQIGKKLAAEITRMFPFPMQMKFQKVYESLFLISKKHYYGKSYESKDSVASYEGKGIQTVRRDGIPYTSEVLDSILKATIDTKDLSTVKEILMRQSKRLLQGLVSENQLCLAKEVKLLKYNPKYLPAHGQAARRLEAIDPMLLPRYGERLKYLIIQGSDAIKTRAIPLFEYMLHRDKYQLDLNYYYSNLFLPPLRRALISLVNLDQWGSINQFSRGRKDQDVSEHEHRNKPSELICSECLQEELKQLQTTNENASRICRKCVSSQQIDFHQCIEWNCSNLYSVKKAKEQYQWASHKTEQLKLIKQLMNC